MQFTALEKVDELDEEFTHLSFAQETPFQVNGLLQVLDDFGPKMTFEHANVFSGKSISVGKENGRIIIPVIFPYKMVRSSRGFTLYERVR